MTELRHYFDRFAPSFDRTLGRLGYVAPSLVTDSLVRHHVGGADILDAGCGTGLSGAALAPLARFLVGVDLSRQMLKRAAARRCYSALVQGDVDELLEVMPERWDVIAAVDTFVYLEELRPTFVRARHALRPGGLLVCTLEAEENLRGPSDFRFGHSAEAVRAAADTAGLQVVELNASRLRDEQKMPVIGWIIVMVRNN